jgi:predicted transcriptional regulator
MSKNKIKKCHLGARVPEPLYNQLKELADKSGLSVSFMITKAVAGFVKENTAQSELKITLEGIKKDAKVATTN